MKPSIVASPATTRPSRILVLLAAAWMVLSLAIGGALAADERTSATPRTEAVTGVSQP